MKTKILLKISLFLSKMADNFKDIIDEEIGNMCRYCEQYN